MSAIAISLKQKDITDDVIEKMIQQLIKKMGEEFPEDVRPLIARYIQKSFNQGQNYKVGIKPNRKVLPKDAIRFFTNVMKINIGQSFKNREPKFREAVKKILVTGKRTEAISELQKALGDMVSDPGELKKMNWMLRDMTNRTRNYSRVDRFSQLGIAEVEIVSVLDSRTSEICKLMHGRRVKVEQAREFVATFTATDPEKVFDEFKLPPRDVISGWDGKSTTDILKELKIKLPPYHAGGCRSTVVASFKTKLTARSGKEFQGKVEKPDMKALENQYLRRASKTKSQERRREIMEEYQDKVQEINGRFGDLKNLTSQELLSKVDALKSATWDEQLLVDHFKDHAEIKKDIVSKSVKEYEKMARAILEKPDEIYAYIDDQTSERRFGFRLKKTGHFVAVGYDSMRVHTLHVRNESGVKNYIKIL